MPWSNQGGGPLGFGAKGPWGSGPQSGGGSTPPDLEDLLRRSQDKLKTFCPAAVSVGGLGLSRWSVAVRCGIVRDSSSVQPGELGVVQRFGKYVRDAPAGWDYTWPYPVGAVQKVNIERINRIDVGMRIVDDARRGTTTRDVPEESLMLTGDENIVDVDFAVLWKIKPDRARPVPVQHPVPGRHREGGRRKRDARGGRPLQHPADPDRRAAEYRDRRARPDAEDARRYAPAS